MIAALWKSLGKIAACAVFAFGSSTPSLAASIKVEQVESKLGIKALLVHDAKLPLIALHFAFRGGVEQDPAGKEGLAHLATELLTQGAGPYDDMAFQDLLAQDSIRLNFSAGRDALVGAVKTLASTRKKAFDLLHLALVAPRCAPEALARVRGQMIAESKTQMDDPAWQARYALYATLYGDHPYGKRSLGSAASVESLTPEDAKTFLKKHMARDNLVVAAAGAITAEELARVLDEVFGDLPAKAEETPIPDVSWPAVPPIISVARQGTQTSMYFAAPMLRREDKDWYAAEIANYILGGGSFSSRLMQTVREKEGLTYGIGTDLAPMDHDSLLIGRAATDDPKAGRAYDLTVQVWKDLYEKGPSDEEVAAAKAFLIGSLPLHLTTTSAIAGALVSVQLDHLPADYFEKKKEFLSAVTPKDVQRVLRRWFDPAKAAFSFVGAPEGITPSLTRSLVRE